MDEVVAQPKSKLDANKIANAAINVPKVGLVDCMFFTPGIRVMGISDLPTKSFHACDKKARKFAGLRCASKALFGCIDQMICVCAGLHIDRDGG